MISKMIYLLIYAYITCVWELPRFPPDSLSKPAVKASIIKSKSKLKNMLTFD